MKTAEIINIVCSDLGIAKADLAKRMGMIPSSLYRKLARESITLRELQECLDVLGVEMEINLRYPDGNARSPQVNQELLISRLQREKRTLWHMWIREGKRTTLRISSLFPVTEDISPSTDISRIERCW